MKYHQNSIVRVAVLICFVVLAPICAAQADSDRKIAPLLGGEFVDVSKSAAAFVFTGEGHCSGLLVGTREVLTAAHCVVSNIPNSKFIVVVGNQAYGVASRWYPQGYESSEEYTPEIGRYDLGLIELNDDVINVAPVPVLYDDPLLVGEVGFVIGFGLHETEYNEEIPLSNAKVGDLRVAFLFDGLFETTLASSGIASCSGDSGGPVIQHNYGYYAAVGVVSAGTTVNEGTTCEPANGSFSIFVDLQSKYSRGFLANFPGVQHISGRLIYFSHQIGNLAVAMQKGSRVKNLQLARSRAAALARSVKKLSTFANPARKPGVSSVIKLLNQAAKAPNLKAAASALKKANKRALQSAQMGLN